MVVAGTNTAAIAGPTAAQLAANNIRMLDAPLAVSFKTSFFQKVCCNARCTTTPFLLSMRPMTCKRDPLVYWLDSLCGSGVHSDFDMRRAQLVLA